MQICRQDFFTSTCQQNSFTVQEGARIVLGAAALKVALRQKPGNEIGKSRAVDAGQLHKSGLTYAFVLVNRQEHCVLALCKAGFADFFLVDVGGVLCRSFQQMIWGA